MLGLRAGRMWAGALAALALLAPLSLGASEAEKPVKRHYVTAPAAPEFQTEEQVNAKSISCLGCHTKTDRMSMHATPAVRLGCVDCHGGDANVAVTKGLTKTDPAYVTARDKAHVLPRYPET